MKANQKPRPNTLLNGGGANFNSYYALLRCFWRRSLRAVRKSPRSTIHAQTSSVSPRFKGYSTLLYLYIHIGSTSTSAGALPAQPAPSSWQHAMMRLLSLHLSSSPFSKRNYAPAMYVHVHTCTDWENNWSGSYWKDEGIGRVNSGPCFPT